MAVSIRAARREDVNGVHDLVYEWGYTASESQVQVWLDELVISPNHNLFVAVSNDSIAGWVVVEKRISLDSGFTSEITGLIVGSSFRRLGIGNRLVNAAEEWALSLGLSQVVVRSNVNRLESHEFYRSLGFELRKTAHVYSKVLRKA